MGREPSNGSTSDAELLNRSFTTSDPENLPDLVFVVPESKERPEIEFAYDLTPPQGPLKRPFIRCVHCKYPNHWKGYVMRTVEGQRFLVGKDCGATLYGAQFTVIERTFSIGRARQLHLRRLTAAKAAFPACLQAVAMLKGHPALSSYQQCRTELHRSMPPLWSSLVASATRGMGALTVTERIRDHAAEQRRAERQKSNKSEFDGLTLSARKRLRKEGRLPQNDEKPIYQFVEQTVGQLAGTGLFQGVNNATAVMADVQAGLQRMFKEIDGARTDDILSTRLAILVGELTEAIGKIENELDRLITLRDFFDLRNLNTVCAWASRREDCEGAYKVSGRGIEWKNIYGDVVTVQPPADYEVPRPQGIELFKLALTQ